MNTILYPDARSWPELCRRPGIDKSDLNDTVRAIINTVKSEKDQALHFYSEKFEGAPRGNLKVSPKEMKDASGEITDALKRAIDIARNNIEKFHSSQLIKEPVIETSPGVKCWRNNRAIERVGLYIPGGSAPLFSTVLMLGIPAKLAGCREIIICSPAGKDGKLNPLILYTAQLLGITEIYRIGGAQAIAAMAYGTESIARVGKIFGPGNQYVTKAKELVQQDGIAIDMPAGPSEVLVIADSAANAGFIAADLLSQAEHGADSQVIMLTDNQALTESVKAEIDLQLIQLPRADIASKALNNSKLILLPSMSECIDFSNRYAPEHLIINTANSHQLAERVINAGSVFLGSFSCESAGDYASGTNHTLPTNGYAMSYSGVSTDSFVKKITFQEITHEGIMNLGPVIELMAEAESLHGHKNAVSIRLNSIKNG
jgi:histidinol dehydrogenase